MFAMAQGFDRSTYVLLSLLFLMNAVALLIFASKDLSHKNQPELIAILCFFSLTYLLDLVLHFYYLKNDHLNKVYPRLVMTALRSIGFFSLIQFIL
jgi:hypothetical protein